MVDDIKKAFIFNDQIQLVGPGNTHTVRYRIVTDDGQKTSEWSAPYQVPAKTIAPGTSVSLTASAGSIFKAAWSDTNNPYAYDIFVSLGQKISTYNLTSNVVTLVTFNNHGFKTGDLIDVVNTGSGTINTADSVVLSTPTSKSLTYAKVAANIATTTPSGTNPRIEIAANNTTDVVNTNFKYLATIVNTTDQLSRTYSYVSPTITNAESNRVLVQIAGIVKQPDNSLVVTVTPSTLKLA